MDAPAETRRGSCPGGCASEIGRRETQAVSPSQRIYHRCAAAGTYKAMLRVYSVDGTTAATIVVHVPDLDGSQPDIWRFIEEVRENDLQADPAAYR